MTTIKIPPIIGSQLNQAWSRIIAASMQHPEYVRGGKFLWLVVLGAIYGGRRLRC